MTWCRALRSFVVWLVPAIVFVPAVASGQDLVPRAYLATPVGSNAFILSYSFAEGEFLFDPTLPITDATGKIQTPVASYYYAFDFFGRAANVTGALPYAMGELRGKVAGNERAIQRSGTMDAVVRFAVNLYGSPARRPPEFIKSPPSRSIVGASLKVTAPTGQYYPTRLVNIGTNRWAFKPELGFTHRIWQLVFDAYGGVWLFTDNHDFAPTPDTPHATRSQDPIAALEFHLSYDVKPRLWISGDVNYWRGGRTSVNGRKGIETLQANSRIGVTGSVPVTAHQAIKVSYSDGVLVRVGGNFRVLSVGWQLSWLGLPSRGNS
jgi:Putative MetA-pathway of phenol degradation